MTVEEITALDWIKMDGLLPVIIQDAETQAVLMLGYMNQIALQQTLETKWVTFYSRSKKRLWVKGESSGHKLKLLTVDADCDADALLITVQPQGPTCHTGTVSCFQNVRQNHFYFLETLESTIAMRQAQPTADSYTCALFAEGISRMAQKVGEEGVEVALAAVSDNTENLCGEIADLLFHILVLLRAKDLRLIDVLHILKERHKS